MSDTSLSDLSHYVSECTVRPDYIVITTRGKIHFKLTKYLSNLK